jgi:hypothetical protein
MPCRRGPISAAAPSPRAARAHRNTGPRWIAIQGAAAGSHTRLAAALHLPVCHKLHHLPNRVTTHNPARPQYLLASHIASHAARPRDFDGRRHRRLLPGLPAAGGRRARRRRRLRRQPRARRLPEPAARLHHLGRHHGAAGAAVRALHRQLQRRHARRAVHGALPRGEAPRSAAPRRAAQRSATALLLAAAQTPVLRPNPPSLAPRRPATP